jgi:hypothetical protein
MRLALHLKLIPVCAHLTLTRSPTIVITAWFSLLNRPTVRGYIAQQKYCKGYPGSTYAANKCLFAGFRSNLEFQAQNLDWLALSLYHL